MIDLWVGDCRTELKTMAAGSINCVVTSPPYFGLRDYGIDGQIGLEPTPDEYVAELVNVFREVRRVLRDDGTLWLNIGDTYASAWPCSRRNVIGNGSLANGKRENRPPRLGNGLKEKDLIGIPWRVAFALQADGWYLRQDIIWSKPNPMPESVTDRCTKSHEYVFLLSKSARYHFDAEAIKEPATYPNGSGNTREYKVANSRAGKNANITGGLYKIGPRDTRNKRSVWTINTKPLPDAHFATFPPALVEPCILAGCPIGGLVLDPFGGAGTVGLVADRLGRDAIIIELNEAYLDIAERRILGDQEKRKLIISKNSGEPFTPSADVG